MSARRGLRRGVACGLGAMALLAPVASAHVQVSPTVAAPGDPTLVTVVVPGESDVGTRQVEMKMPDGVIPFSFEDTPGWARRIARKPNGGVDRIIWTGRLAKDGFVRFSFIAGTPTTPGTIAWKTLQTYADGEVVSWIGGPGSETPAPTTLIDAAATPQNAGGEGSGTTPSASATATAAPTAAGDDGGTDWPARGLALGGLLCGAGALVVAVRRRPGAGGGAGTGG